MSDCYLGVEIGGTKLQIVTGDGDGTIRSRERLTVDAAKGGEGIREQLAAALTRQTAKDRIKAMGIGFGGPVDRRTGCICRSHQVEGWTDFDLRGWAEDWTGLRTVIENDANTAALGEALRGAGVQCNPVFYVTLGSGVGGGLITHGDVYHGQIPGEAEIGHVRLDRSGQTVESRCSGWALDGRIRALCEAHPEIPLARAIREQPGLESRHLGSALQANDAHAEELLAELTDDLGLGLSHVTHLFHPEIIVLGGGLSQIGEPLRAGVGMAIRRYVMEAFQPGPRVVLAALQEDAVPVGALILAHRHAGATS
jgi:glucokinase